MRMGKFIRVAGFLPSSIFFYARALTIGNLYQSRRRTQHASSCLKSLPAATTSAVEIIQENDDINTFQNDYTIREALYSELQVIASLVTAGFHPELDSNPFLRPIRVLLELDRLQNNFPYPGDENRHMYLVCEAKKDNKLVGFCDIDARIPANKKKENPFSPFASTIYRPHPYFSDLTVDPNYRRKGIASALVEEGERRAKDMNCQEMYLGVASTNTVALDLYSKMGYEIIVPIGDILEFVKRQEGVRMLRRTLN